MGVIFDRTNIDDRDEREFDGKSFARASRRKYEAYVLADVKTDDVQDVVNIDVMVMYSKENRLKERELVKEMTKAGNLCGYDYVSHWVDMMSYSDRDLVQAVFEARRTEAV